MKVKVIVYNAFYKIFRKSFFETELESALPADSKGLETPKIWDHKRIGPQGKRINAAHYLFLGHGSKHPRYFHRKIGTFKASGLEHGDIDTLAFFKALKYIEVCKLNRNEVIFEVDILPNSEEPLELQAQSLYLKFEEDHHLEISLASKEIARLKKKVRNNLTQASLLDPDLSSNEGSNIAKKENEANNILFEARIKIFQQDIEKTRNALVESFTANRSYVTSPTMPLVVEGREDWQSKCWLLDIAVLEFGNNRSGWVLDCSLKFNSHLSRDKFDYYKGKTDFAHSQSDQLLIHFDLDAEYKNFPLITKIDFGCFPITNSKLYIGHCLLTGTSHSDPCAFVIRLMTAEDETSPQRHEVPIDISERGNPNAAVEVDKRILKFFSHYLDVENHLDMFFWKFKHDYS